VYISRSNISHHRNVVNEIEIKKFLISQGFKIIYPEKLSVIKQIQIFSAAHFIIGATGAWASNLLYCGKLTKVCIFGPLDYQGTFFQHISSINSLEFTSIVGNSIPSLMYDRPHWNYYVPIENINKAINE